MTYALIKQLEAVMQSGDEAQVRSFVAEHFHEFPEATQRELAVALFREAMAEDLKQREALVALKEEAVEAIEAIEELEKRETSDGL